MTESTKPKRSGAKKPKPEKPWKRRRQERRAAEAQKAGQPVPKPRTGRPTLCTDAVIKLAVEAAELAASNKDAALYAGISVAAWEEWHNRASEALKQAGYSGELGEEVDLATIAETERPFVLFATSVVRARAKGRVGRLRVIDFAGRGGLVFDKDGNQVGGIDGDWKASAHLLEVSDPSSYGLKKRVEMTGEGGGPVGVSFFNLPREDGEEAEPDGG